MAGNTNKNGSIWREIAERYKAPQGKKGSVSKDGNGSIWSDIAGGKGAKEPKTAREGKQPENKISADDARVMSETIANQEEFKKNGGVQNEPEVDAISGAQPATTKPKSDPKEDANVIGAMIGGNDSDESVKAGEVDAISGAQPASERTRDVSKTPIDDNAVMEETIDAMSGAQPASTKEQLYKDSAKMAWGDFKASKEFPIPAPVQQTASAEEQEASWLATQPKHIQAGYAFDKAYKAYGEIENSKPYKELMSKIAQAEEVGDTYAANEYYEQAQALKDDAFKNAQALWTTMRREEQNDRVADLIGLDMEADENVKAWIAANKQLGKAQQDLDAENSWLDAQVDQAMEQYEPYADQLGPEKMAELREQARQELAALQNLDTSEVDGLTAEIADIESRLTPEQLKALQTHTQDDIEYAEALKTKKDIEAQTDGVPEAGVDVTGLTQLAYDYSNPNVYDYQYLLGFYAKANGIDVFQAVGDAAQAAGENWNANDLLVKREDELAQYMEPEEVAALNKIVAYGTPEQALEYYEALTTDLRWRAITQQEINDHEFATNHPLLATAREVSLPVQIAKAAEFVGEALGTVNGSSRVEIRYGARNTRRYSTAIGTVSQNILMKNQESFTFAGKEFTYGEMINFCFQTGMSMGESAQRMFLGPVGLAIGGMDAGSATYLSAMDRDLSTWQALGLSSIACAAEVVTEKVSLDELFSHRTGGNFWQSVGEALKQMVTEGSEEVASDILNDIGDWMIAGGDHTELTAAAKQLFDEAAAKNAPISMNEAYWRAALAGYAESFLGGAVSGLGFGTIEEIVNVNRKGGYKAIRDARQFYAISPEQHKQYTQDIIKAGYSPEVQQFMIDMMDQLAEDPSDVLLTNEGREQLAFASELMAANADVTAQTAFDAYDTELEGIREQENEEVDSAIREAEIDDALVEAENPGATEEAITAARETVKENAAVILEKVHEMANAKVLEATERAKAEIEKAQNQRKLADAFGEFSKKATAALEAGDLNAHADIMNKMRSALGDLQAAKELEAQEKKAQAVMDEQAAQKADDEIMTVAETAAQNIQAANAEAQAVVDTALNEADNVIKTAQEKQDGQIYVLDGERGRNDGNENIGVRSRYVQQSESRESGERSDTRGSGVVSENSRENGTAQTEKRAVKEYDERRRQSLTSVVNYAKKDFGDIKVKEVSASVANAEYHRNANTLQTLFGGEGFSLYEYEQRGEKTPPYGFADKTRGLSFVQYTGRWEDFFRAGHEQAHHMRGLQQTILNSPAAQDAAAAYLNLQGLEDNAKNREEFACDVAGAFAINYLYESDEYDLATRNALGLSRDQFEELMNTVADGLMADPMDMDGDDGDSKISGFATSLTSMDHDYNLFKKDLADAGLIGDGAGQMTQAEYDDLFNAIDYAMDIIGKNRKLLDFDEGVQAGERSYSPYKQNSDPHYKMALDFSTLCRKRVLLQSIVARLQSKLKRSLTAEEQVAIRSELQKMQKEGYKLEVACALCYVEAARFKSPKRINKFLDNIGSELTHYFALKNKEFQSNVSAQQKAFKEERGYTTTTTLKSGKQKTKHLGKKDMSTQDAELLNKMSSEMRKNYTPTEEEKELIEKAKKMDRSVFLDPEKLAKLAMEEPRIFEAFTSTIRAATRSKSLETDVAYWRGDVESVSDSIIQEMNEESGFRHQSWSDFQVKHLLDTISAVIELSTRGAKMHAYTKVADLIHLCGNTGMMINASLIPSGQTGIVDGNLIFDDVEGFKFGRIGIDDDSNNPEADPQSMLYLRDKYHETVGNIAIGINDSHIRMLLDSDLIDYVIPYHISGLNKGLRTKMNIPGWADYTRYQNEKAAVKGAAGVAPRLNEWFDMNEARKAEDGVAYMQEASKEYLRLCNERNLIPKFAQFLKKGPNGYELADDAMNYWKLLIDRKMVDQKTNKIIEQKAVLPKFDKASINGILQREIDDPASRDHDAVIDTIEQRFRNGEIKLGKENQRELEAYLKREYAGIKDAANVQDEMVNGGVAYSTTELGTKNADKETGVGSKFYIVTEENLRGDMETKVLNPYRDSDPNGPHDIAEKVSGKYPIALEVGAKYRVTQEDGSTKDVYYLGRNQFGDSVTDDARYDAEMYDVAADTIGELGKLKDLNEKVKANYNKLSSIDDTSSDEYKDTLYDHYELMNELNEEFGRVGRLPYIDTGAVTVEDSGLSMNGGFGFKRSKDRNDFDYWIISPYSELPKAGRISDYGERKNGNLPISPVKSESMADAYDAIGNDITESVIENNEPAANAPIDETQFDTDPIDSVVNSGADEAPVNTTKPKRATREERAVQKARDEIAGLGKKIIDRVFPRTDGIRFDRNSADYGRAVQFANRIANELSNGNMDVLDADSELLKGLTDNLMDAAIVEIDTTGQVDSTIADSGIGKQIRSARISAMRRVPGTGMYEKAFGGETMAELKKQYPYLHFVAQAPNAETGVVGLDQFYNDIKGSLNIAGSENEGNVVENMIMQDYGVDSENATWDSAAEILNGIYRDYFSREAKGRKHEERRGRQAVNELYESSIGTDYVAKVISDLINDEHGIAFEKILSAPAEQEMSNNLPAESADQNEMGNNVPAEDRSMMDDMVDDESFAAPEYAPDATGSELYDKMMAAAERPTQEQAAREERGSNTSERNARSRNTAIRQAEFLYNSGKTVADYYDAVKDKQIKGLKTRYDKRVANHLRGMLLRNGQNVGGLLNNKTMNELNEHMVQNQQFAQNRLSFMSPYRVFDKVYSPYQNDTIEHIKENRRIAGAVTDATVEFGLQQNAARALWESDAGERAAEWFDKTGTEVAIATQMLGEGVINEEQMSQALYGNGYFMTNAIDGTILCGREGKILAISDSTGTKIVDKNLKQKIAKMIPEVAAGLKAEKNEKADRRAVERLRAGLGDGEPISIDTTMLIDFNGDKAVCRIGDTVIAEITNGTHVDGVRTTENTTSMREWYNKAWDDQNRVLTDNGYAPMGYVASYFPHPRQGQVTETTVSDLLKGFLEEDALPTAINGMTSEFKPGHPWAAHLLANHGEVKQFNAATSFNKYVKAAGMVLYNTPVVQRMRQFESYTRANSPDNKNSALVAWLREYGNHWANKKSDLDRPVERLLGRTYYTVSSALTRFMGQSAVAGSFSSALSNFISELTAIPDLDKVEFAKQSLHTIPQLLEYLKNGDDKDGITDKIPFLAARHKAYDAIITNKRKRAVNKYVEIASTFFTASDFYTSEVVARTKYAECMKKGMTEAEAIKATDKFCIENFADRGTGMMPSVFNAKAIRPIMQFGLETLNQLSHASDMHGRTLDSIVERYDREIEKYIDENGTLAGIDLAAIEKQVRGYGNRKDIAKGLMYSILLSMWGGFTRALLRRDQTWNPIGMGYDFYQDVQKDGVGTAMSNLKDSVLEQTPVVGSLMGGGRIPISTIFDNAGDAAQALQEGLKNGIDASTLERLGVFLSNFPPTGGQIRKTVQGVSTVAQGGSYSKKGELRYPVDQTAGNYIKGALFGKGALQPAGYDYKTGKLSGTQTAQYKEIVDHGFGRKEAYDLVRGFNGATNATSALSLAAETQDMSTEDQQFMAEVLMSDTFIKSGKSLVEFGKEAAEDYIKNNKGSSKYAKTVDIIEMYFEQLGLNN